MDGRRAASESGVAAMAPGPSAIVPGLGARLLALARAQAVALAEEDFERFTRLADERDALMAVLARGGLARLEWADRAALEQVAELDRETTGLAARLLQETEQERRRLHHGRTALKSYGRPGAQLASRPAFLDRAG